MDGHAGSSRGFGSDQFAALSSRDADRSYTADQEYDDEPQAKKPRRPSENFNGPPASDPNAELANAKTAKRASQACLRCRKQKLRCLGGWPCDRCTKGRYDCDFGAANLPPGPRPGQAQQNAAAAAAQEANARLQQLESSVASLLAGLAGQQDGQQVPGTTLNQLLHQAGLDKHAFGAAGVDATTANAGRTLSFADSRDGGDSTLPGWQPSLPPPTHSRPLITPRLASHTTVPLAGPSSDPHVRFAASPHTAYSAPSLTSPSNAASSGISPGSALSGEGAHIRKSGAKQGKGQKAEERLAAATEGEFEPPFKSLVYQVRLVICVRKSGADV